MGVTPHRPCPSFTGQGNALARFCHYTGGGCTSHPWYPGLALLLKRERDTTCVFNAMRCYDPRGVDALHTLGMKARPCPAVEARAQCHMHIQHLHDVMAPQRWTHFAPLVCRPHLAPLLKREHDTTCIFNAMRCYMTDHALHHRNPPLSPLKH